MKKTLAKLFGFIALCFSIVSCNNKEDPYFYLNSQLPMVVPFALDKAGNKAVIDFWVRPGRQDTDIGSYMLALRFEREEENNIETLENNPVNRTETPLKVKLFSIKNNDEIPLNFKGSPVFSNAYQSGVEIGREGGIVYPNERGFFSTGKAYVVEKIIATFGLKEYGRYRIYIETINDNDALQGKIFDLYVSDNNTGK